MVRSFVSLLSRLDRFGHKMEMHYEGRTEYNTGFGGCLSIIVYVLILVNAINIGSDFIYDEN